MEKQSHSILILPIRVKKYVVGLENSALNHTANKQSDKADATITLSRASLNDVLLGNGTFEEKVQAGDIKVVGNNAKVKELISMLDTFEFWFNIVTPVKIYCFLIAHIFLAIDKVNFLLCLMGWDNMKLKYWKTKKTFIDEKGDVYFRKEIEGNIRWYKYDFVDIPIINSKKSDLLEEEYKRISGKYSNSSTKKND